MVSGVISPDCSQSKNQPHRGHNNNLYLLLYRLMKLIKQIKNSHMSLERLRIAYIWHTVILFILIYPHLP